MRKVISPCWLPWEHYVGRYAPCRQGDVLYVREAFQPMFRDADSGEIAGYIYRADERRAGAEDYGAMHPEGEGHAVPGKWRPTIHMPKKAARIWLKVTGVCLEKLQDMTEEDAFAEGMRAQRLSGNAADPPLMEEFGKQVWNPTVRKTDLPRYGWDANPWVWVVKFEKSDGLPV